MYTVPSCGWCTRWRVVAGVQCHLVAGVHNAVLWLVYTRRVAGDKECEWPVTEDTPSKKGIIVKPNLVQKLKKK